MWNRICSLFVKFTLLSMVIVAGAGGCGGGGSGLADGAAGNVENVNPCVVGVDGWCWSVYQQPSTTAAWVTPPSATTVHAYLTHTAQPHNAGVYFNFPVVTDLTRFDRIIFTTTASGPFAFVVSINVGTAGCATNFYGSGTRTTYTFGFSTCDFWSDDTSKPPFSFALTDQVTWQTLWGPASSLDIEIVPDVLFCLGTQCTANPLSP